MTCCEKGGRRGRRACRVQRWHHRGDVVFQTGGLAYDKFKYKYKYVTNIDSIFNKKKPMKYTVEINIFYKEYRKKIKIDVIKR